MACEIDFLSKTMHKIPVSSRLNRVAATFSLALEEKDLKVVALVDSGNQDLRCCGRMTIFTTMMERDLSTSLSMFSSKKATTATATATATATTTTGATTTTTAAAILTLSDDEQRGSTDTDTSSETEPPRRRASGHPVKHTDFTPERSIESYGLLDLYSYDAFRTVLHTPRIHTAFASFLCSEHSQDNLTFWSRCQTYKQIQSELAHSAQQIKNDHLQEGSCEEINVRQKTRVEGVNKVEGMLLLCHETENVFEELRKEVEMLMWRDSYPRFLKHHLAYNASKSLEWYPGKTFTFKGLGECFCITNPRRQDNPIELCSDAFIKVTGFPVSKIINHNSRFLQGSLSDKATVNRIRISINQGKESTEVFLNYRHDGTPFWNLLLVAPLRNETGEIEYFFGAQVDGSALFQKHNDLSAILSKDFALSEPRDPPTCVKETRKEFPSAEPTISESRKSFFRRLSEKTRIHTSKQQSMVLTPGLEEEVVRENITSIGEQVDVFRSAYARYLIVDIDTKIQFCSEAAQFLFPNPCQNQQIFPLLTNTISNIDSKSLKSLQKAFHNGQPTSIRLTVSPPSTPTSATLSASVPFASAPVDADDAETRSRQGSTTTTNTSAGSVGGLFGRKRTGGSWGDGVVVSVHLTPLKDEHGKVGKFVFVLATAVGR